MSKKEESSELEGLIAEDGSQSVDKGLTLVEYSRKDPGIIRHMDMDSGCFDLRRESKPETKRAQVTRDRKRGTVAVLEKTQKEPAVSTTVGRKGGRRKRN